MRILVLTIGLGVLLIGCGEQAIVGQRYRAERALWNANRELRLLSVRPELVTKDRWLTMAAQYEALASGFVQAGPAEDTTSTGEAHRIQTIKARALITAAQIHSSLRDSTRMMELYDRVDTEFADVPTVRAEVAWARGQIAEGKGEWARASVEYQGVVDRIDPDPGGTGLPGLVMRLPLHIARLAVREAGDSAMGPHYDEAGRYYNNVIRGHPGSNLELEAKYFLANLAVDLGDRTRATGELRGLEERLQESDSPPRNPAEIRFLIGMIQLQGNASPDSSRRTFLSVIEDYPEESVAPKSLQILAGISAEQGQTEKALTYLDRIPEEYPGAEQVAAEAMLAKGLLLEQNDRWPEALGILRALPKTYPFSEPALMAPLKVVAHGLRVEDTDHLSSALETAERGYREFAERYPSGPLTISAREKLVQVLYLQERYEEAVSELTSLGESLTGTPQGAALLVNAARMALSALQDTSQAADILDLTGTLYAKDEIGRWASAEASRLRRAKE